MPFSVASTLEKHMRKCIVHQKHQIASGGVSGIINSASGVSNSALDLVAQSQTL